MTTHNYPRQKRAIRLGGTEYAAREPVATEGNAMWRCACLTPAFGVSPGRREPLHSSTGARGC